jgi:hypothetical protein
MCPRAHVVSGQMQACADGGGDVCGDDECNEPDIMRGMCVSV